MILVRPFAARYAVTGTEDRGEVELGKRYVEFILTPSFSAKNVGWCHTRSVLLVEAYPLVLSCHASYWSTSECFKSANGLLLTFVR